MFKEVLQGFSEKTKPFEFAPLVCPTTLQDESLSSEAKAIASSVAEHHVPIINEEVDTSYSRWFDDLPEEVKDVIDDTDTMRATWLRENYFDIVRQVVETNPTNSLFAFHPQVAPESLASPDAIIRSKALIARAQPCHVARIEEEVNKQYADFRATISKMAREKREEQVKTNWLKKTLLRRH